MLERQASQSTPVDSSTPSPVTPVTKEAEVEAEVEADADEVLVSAHKTSHDCKCKL